MQDSTAQPSREHRPNEDTDDVEVIEGKADLWTPLNCLVEAANRKSSKLNSQVSTASMTEQHNGPDCCAHAPEAKPGPESPPVPDGRLCVHKSKSKEHRNNSVALEEENSINLIKRPVKRRRLHAEAQKKVAASNRIMLDALGSKWNRKNNPIWFSLIACEGQ